MTSALYPLSELQVGLWYQDKLSERSSSHNVPVRFDFSSSPDIERLQSVCDTLFRSNGCFHSRITEREDGVPCQYWVSPPPCTITVIQAEEVNGPAIEHLLRGEIARLFMLRNDPLYRLTLFRMADGRATLLIVIHHIIFDGQSAAMFTADFMRLWTRPDEPLSMVSSSTVSDYQSTLLSSSVTSRALDYWRTQLADAPSEITLPALPNAGNTTRKAETLSHRFPDELYARAEAYCRHHAVTPFMLHTLICSVLLMRYSQSMDIVVGVPVSLRKDDDKPFLAGLFVNVLPLRLRATTETTAEALLHQIRNRLIRTMMHSNISFHELVRELRPTRHETRNPFFQICINHARVGEQLCDTGVRAVPMGNEVAAFDLDFILAEHDDNFNLITEYRASRFEAETVKGFTRHYFQLLEEILSESVKRVSAYAMLTKEELGMMLETWNTSPHRYSDNLTVLTLFEEQVQRTPDGIALRFSEGELTYDRLNRRANQLAHFLTSNGIRAGQRVAVCLPRGPEFIVTIYGILKAGAAYVPVDPDYPAERKHYISEDAGASAMIVQGASESLSTVPLVIDPASPEIVCKLMKQPETRPESQPRPDDIIYCIYTSGSTGKPKGALNTHRSVANLVMWYIRDALEMKPAESVILASSLSFDLTQKNIFGPLACGGMVIIPDSSPADAIGFLRALSYFQPHYLCCAPSAYRAFSGSSRCRSLKKIVLGGEVIEPALANTVLRSGKTLINSYGPTECADIAIWSMYRPGEFEFQGPVPLGRPVPGCRIYILDDDFNPVPAGVDGEIFIGGAGVGPGYLERESLTSEKFLPDPFTLHGTMYRTGDRGRFRQNGVIEFAGRRDGQIKLRGFRIELGEIESAIQSTGLIEQVCVQARYSEAQGQRLVAWYVVREGQTVNRNDIVVRLKEIIPVHMIPDTWICLDAMPLSPNGKTDRLKLQQMDSVSATVSAAPIVAPVGETEHALHRIWQEVLGLSTLGVEDNFFLSGGHSLLAMVCLARINRELDLQLPGTAITRHQTIRELAAFIAHTRSEMPSCFSTWAPCKGPVIWCFPAAGLRSTSYRQLAQSLAQNAQLNVLDYPAPTSEESSSIEALVAFFVNSLEPHIQGNSLVLAGHSFGSTIALEVGRCMYQRGMRVKLIIIEGTIIPPERLSLDTSKQEDPLSLVSSLFDESSVEKYGGELKHLASEHDALYQQHLRIFRNYYSKGVFEGESLVLSGRDGEIYRQLGERLQAYYAAFCTRLTTVVTSGDHMSLIMADHAPELAVHLLEFVKVKIP
ncbi:non-ribosomal peptide synthetase [Xenorhabdus griffiniae]|nr:non-ribosomal peptide synthetase [Xenorhabdus griffiniae]MBD1228701.1 amino acid adenylation domain-containing protein [Xenorhabdus griffiniae]